MACGCIDDVNRDLREQEGAKLDLLLLFKDGTLVERPYSALIRLDNGRREHRRNRRTAFIASYCPFCGRPYEAVAPAEAPAPAGVPHPDAPPVAPGGVDDQAPRSGPVTGAAPLAPETGA